MPDQFVAICGQSAVGKATLIERLLNGESELRQRFDLCNGAIRAFGTRFGPFTEQHANAELVLWKWQWNADEYFNELKMSYPDANHSAIVIWLPPGIHYEWLEKKWPNQAKKQSPDKLKRGFAQRIAPIFGIRLQALASKSNLSMVLP